MGKWINLALGSLAGGFSRYLLAGATHKLTSSNFPYGTLVVNLLGCFLIGLFDSLANEKFLLGTSERLLLMTGFCGAFTTFSTFILETSHLAQDGEFGRAFLNIAMSIFLGFVLFRMGNVLGKII